jgi:hypothetical protein
LPELEVVVVVVVVDVTTLAGVLVAGRLLRRALRIRRRRWATAGAGAARVVLLACCACSSSVTYGTTTEPITAPERAIEASGAGPIAAPTATPRTSIEPARMAVARREGRRSGEPGAGLPDRGSPGGKVGGGGVSAIVGRASVER